jgi:hypothetical protein
MRLLRSLRGMFEPRVAFTPRPIPSTPLHGVVTDDEVKQLRARNAERIANAQRSLGDRWVLATPMNAGAE